MNIQTVKRSPAEAALIRQFDGERAGVERAAAFARFAERGLPTRRIEAWHYTDLRAAMTEAAAPADAPDATRIEAARGQLEALARIGVARLVLVDGYFAEGLSDELPQGVTIGGDIRSLSANDAMVGLNEAMTESALGMSVADGAAVEGAIEIVHLASGEAQSVYSRIAIAVGETARVSFVERFVGARAASQRNALTSLTLGARATASHVALIEDDAGLHVESQVARLAKNAELKAFGLVAGGGLTRRQLFIEAKGADAKIALGGLTLIDGARRADTTLRVTHAATGGTSREFYRAIVDDEGIGTFQGKIIVEQAAQKTDGAMKSQAVLLSPHAQMNAKPELEIFADDVLCGHGATVAALDPEQLFYLRARGIPKGEAEAMLLEGFGGEAIDRIEDEALAEAARVRFRQWLASGRTEKGA